MEKLSVKNLRLIVLSSISHSGELVSVTAIHFEAGVIYFLNHGDLLSVEKHRLDMIKRGTGKM